MKSDGGFESVEGCGTVMERAPAVGRRREPADPVGSGWLSSERSGVGGRSTHACAGPGSGALRLDRGLSFTLGARISFVVVQGICITDSATAIRCALEGSGVVTQATRSEPDLQ